MGGAVAQITWSHAARGTIEGVAERIHPILDALDASGPSPALVALMMVALIGMAGFAIDGSNLYSQHRRLQADLDVAVRVAAAQLYTHDSASPTYTATVTQAMTTAAQLLAQDGYPNTLTSMTSADLQPGPGGVGACSPRDTTAGIWFCTPADTSGSPFYGNTAYLEGHISRDVPSFFGIGIGRRRINVRAVAGQGGITNPMPSSALPPISARSTCRTQRRPSSSRGARWPTATVVVTRTPRRRA